MLQQIPGKLLLLYLLLISINTGLIAQNVVRISGQVYDAHTLESLPGGAVMYGKGRGTITNKEGRYSFTTEPGTVHITFQYVGYKSETFTLSTVDKGDSIVLNIAMYPKAMEIDQVVISAGKSEQRLSELTVSMSVIKPEALMASHTTDAEELINKAAGIEVLDGQASIRGGSGFSYGAGSRVMVLVDGLPMLSADAGHIRWQSMPLENLAQVEIIKGASSVMYGSSALNGIINFRTAKASEEGVTKYFAETGMFGKPKREAWIWWNSPRFFSSASLSHLKKYGNTDIAAGVFIFLDNGYRKLNENYLSRLNLHIKHHHKKVKGLSYGVSLNGMYNQKRDFVVWEDANTGALKQDASTAQRLYGTSLAIDPTISLRRGKRFAHDIRSRILFSRNDYPDGGQNNSDALSQYIEYQFGYTKSQIFSINSGFVHYSSQIFSPFYGDHHAWNAAAYTQANIIPTGRLKLVAGVRLEYNTLDGIKDAIIPLFRTGVNYRLFDITFLRASFGQGYRYPSIAEKYAATTLGSVKIIPNPLINPEKGWNAEIAIKQGLLTQYFDGYLDIATFYTQNINMIEYVFGIYPDPITQQYTMGFKANNIEYSRVYGIELEFVINIKSKRMTHTLTGGYVFMYPVEFNPTTYKNTNTYLKYRRKHSFNVNLNSSIKRFDFIINAFIKSATLDIDDVFINPMTSEDILPGFANYWVNNNTGYFLLDAGISYQFNDRLKLSLVIKNITNTEYMGRPGDIQPHRHISFRVSGKL